MLSCRCFPDIGLSSLKAVILEAVILEAVILNGMVWTADSHRFGTEKLFFLCISLEIKG